MTKIVVVGGGMVGLCSSMMLARRGHEVLVLERNPEEPPTTITEAWEAWDRPGCGQFRMGHWFLAKFREIIETELPELIDGFLGAGALHSRISDMPAPVKGWDDRPGDDKWDCISGRRPVFEQVVAQAAADEPGIEIRRGVAVAGLVAGTPVIAGVPHIVGVRLENGDEVAADLVLDCGGRRSALGRWLKDLDAVPFYEESADCGFRYFGRYFKSKGTIPGARFAQQFTAPSVGGLVLPSDNNTWSLILVSASNDRALGGLTDADRWTRAMESIEVAAPWLDGEPLSDIETMIGIPDRYRRFVVDGVPVATGVEAVGDSWAATNPSLGRGVSMGLMHAMELLAAVDEHLDDPAALALAFDAGTERSVSPHYFATLDLDRVTLANYAAAIAGEAPPEQEPISRAVQAGGLIDQDVRRGFMSIANLLHTAEEVMDEDFFNIVLGLDLSQLPEPTAVPTRDELVALATA